MSHVPFLAVQPDEQFDTEIVKTRDFASTNGFPRSSSSAMDADFADAPQASQLGRVPPATRLPGWIRFPLAVLISFSLSALFYSLVADWAGVELAAVSREYEEEWQVGAVLAWKFAELCTAWYAGYDWKDLASLATLSNLPYYFLLHTFYELHLSSCAIALAIDIATIGIPFALLQPLIHAHEPGGTPNQQVAQDATIFFLMSLFGSAIYAVTVYGSLYTWLPVHIVVHFDGVRSMQHAHDATIPLLVGMLIPIGWATAQFLFTPMIGARGNPGITDPALKPEKVKFDPENATFGETVAFNLGYGPDGFSKRAEVLAKRTAVLISCSVVNTFVRVFVTIAGTELVGAAGWAGVWGIAAALTSVAYAWAGNE
ncbi:hypothetical protein LTR36_007999 [Oleoguttula mirabilis]|uniref:Uncharacterized protein n=1 Tax=Oleoguttula mirabilis TaxID=1507867 RepID=A0AAV9J943_9PEZI|nr:hypothetical protein LTR36_007999 [Oleoguttula mirabilis]